MKTHQDLVEAVYQDVHFRSEFASYVKLQHRLVRSNQTEAPGSTTATFRFVTYLDLIERPLQANALPDAEPIAQCKRGIALLYSSLFKGISTSYSLTDEEVRLIISAVAKQYT